jgi:hypothetical protein
MRANGSSYDDGLQWFPATAGEYVSVRTTADEFIRVTH